MAFSLGKVTVDAFGNCIDDCEALRLTQEHLDKLDKEMRERLEELEDRVKFVLMGIPVIKETDSIVSPGTKVREQVPLMELYRAMKVSEMLEK